MAVGYGPPLASAGFMSEDELRDISRHVRAYVPHDVHELPHDAAINKLRFLLDDVFQSANQQDATTPYTVASWNTLCALIDRCLSSHVAAVRDLVLESHVLDRVFNLYLTRGHSVRPKTAKQLLTCMSDALAKHENHTAVLDLKASILQEAISVLHNKESGTGVKQALLMLSHLLSKRVISINSLMRPVSASAGASVSRVSSADSTVELLDVLMHWITNAEYASSIGQLLAKILQEHPSTSESCQEDSCSHAPWWTRSLRHAFSHSLENGDKLKTYVFPVLFRHDQGDYFRFLRSIGWKTASPEEHSFADEYLLFAALVSGRELGILRIEDEIGENDALSTGQETVRYEEVDQNLMRGSSSARLAGLTLLVASHSMTRPLSVKSLQLLRKHLQHLQADTDADFRSELFGLVARLFDRLRASTAALARQTRSNILQLQDTSISADLLYKAESFISWYLKFLAFELRPSASYQRHICALRSLLVIARSGLDNRLPTSVLSKAAQGETRWPIHRSVLTNDIFQLLVDLLMNPFDDVRQSAASCLALYNTVIITGSAVRDGDRYSMTLQWAESVMLASGRADHADGVAHLYALLSMRDTAGVYAGVRVDYFSILCKQLEHNLEAAHHDLPLAVQKYPLHGILTSIRYVILQRTADDHFLQCARRRLVPVLREVWKVVRPTLCNDAPEGYLPAEVEDTTEVSTKDTLSFCWRALKEASMLIGAIVASIALQSPKGVGEAYDNLRALSDLTYMQLAELRHRGAFSTVAQTWITCCTACQKLENDTGGLLLVSWYEEVIENLRSKLTINTRRSAGLPSLICGLLIADPQTKLFIRAMVDLESISREPVEPHLAHEGSLPQVHGMNCIKDILKNSRLSEKSERFVPVTLKLAADSLRSESWAIRNCGLMLFRAVIDRLLGTNDSYGDSNTEVVKRLVFEKHSQLLDVVLRLLKPPDNEEMLNAGQSEAVFPALQLIQSAEIPESKLLDVQAAVLNLTASTSWHVRDKAARTYSSLVAPDDTVGELDFVLSIADNTRQNALHGLLLCAKYLVKRLRLTSGSVVASGEFNDEPRYAETVDVCKKVVRTRTHLYEAGGCSITKAAFIDLCVEVSSMESALCGMTGKQRLAGGEHKHYSILTDTLLRTELRKTYSTPTCKDPSNAILRRNLHLAFATDQTVEKPNGWPLPEMDIADADVDAYESYMLTLANQEPAIDASIGEELVRLLNARSEPRWRSSTQRALIACLLSSRGRRAAGSSILHWCSDFLFDPTGRQLRKFGGHAETAVTFLECQALLIDLAAMSDGFDFIHVLRIWIEVCKQNVYGATDYEREAAARSLSHLVNPIGKIFAHEDTGDIFYNLSLMTYDLLNDDNEDIRILASKTACSILAALGKVHRDLVPLVAAQKLMCEMVVKRPKQTDLAGTAFERAFNMSENKHATVEQRLAGLNKDANVLFAEEKQNLYIDEARESKAWSQLIMQLDAVSIPHTLVHWLARWADEGLITLLDHLPKQGTSRAWSSRDESFTLGVQVVYAAEILLWLSQLAVTLPIKPSQLLLSLGRLAETSEASGGSCLWKWEIDRILSEAVTVRLKRVGESASASLVS